MKRAVPPDVYTADYYLNDCTGYREYARTFGKTLDPRLQKVFPVAAITNTDVVLDVGCGRGEMAIQAALRGASVVGIDYSKAGVQLAKKALLKQAKTIQRRVSFKQMNAKKLEFPDSTFSVVILTDVVEHLYPEELRLVYPEVFRVLKRGGRVIIHTEPNRWYNDFGYPFYSYPVSLMLLWLNKVVFGKTYPPLPHPRLLRTESHKIMHVNEATYAALWWGLIRAGFRVKIRTRVTILKPLLSWKDRLFNVLVCLDPVSRFLPVSMWLSNDFVVVAEKL